MGISLNYCETCKKVFSESEMVKENCMYCTGLIKGIKIGRKQALKEAAIELLRDRSTESLRPFDVAMRYAVAFLYRKSKQVDEN